VNVAGGVCLAMKCLMPSRIISPGDEWQLGHDDDGRIRGEEHKLCNEQAGAIKGGALRHGNEPPAPRWSPTRRW
jgi:hypothetical protein